MQLSRSQIGKLGKKPDVNLEGTITRKYTQLQDQYIGANLEIKERKRELKHLKKIITRQNAEIRKLKAAGDNKCTHSEQNSAEV